MKDAIHHDRSEMNVLFVHSALDDAGLTPQEFRVYAHLARRSSSGRAWPGIDSMAQVCRVSKQGVVDAIKSMEKYGMLTVKRVGGAGNVYQLTKRSSWDIDRLRTDRSLSLTGQPERTGPVNERERKEIHKKVIQGTSSKREVINSLAEPIYQAYPKKVGRPAALKAIAKAIQRVQNQPDVPSTDAINNLLEKTKAYAKAVEGSDLQFIPHPATWFNQERYNDDPSTWKRAADKRTDRSSVTNARNSNANAADDYR
jgi:predicted DNA-binding transcriptional regulator